jgi:hypothetical protein
MSRGKASAIHLLISAGIAGAMVALMLTVWYPWPLFEAAGGSGLTMILVSVDMALGPLVTLIIFKSGKKGLKFDLALIALVQLSALAYGVHVVYLARPAFLVYTIDRFNLVTAAELDPLDLAQAASPEFRSPPVDGPRYIAAVLPADPKARDRILEFALQGKDLHLFPQYYVPYEQEAQNALKRAKAVGAMLERDASGEVARYLQAAGRSQDSVRYLPLRARSAHAAATRSSCSMPPPASRSGSC